MTIISTNIEEFFKDKSSSYYIYGAGLYCEELSKMMITDGYCIEGIIDKKYRSEDCYINGIPIISLKKLKERNQKSIKIIVTAKSYESVISDLNFFNQKNKLEIECLVPLVKIFDDSIPSFHMDRLLGYFRSGNKLYSIISNDCIAGVIYEALGMSRFSAITPTLNTYIGNEDFLKIMLNPKKYLTADMTAGSKCIRLGTKLVEGIVEDIKVYFFHTDNNVEKCIERWNYLKSNICWDRLVFVIRENEVFSYDYLNRIKKCDVNYLVFKTKNYNFINDSNCYYIPELLNGTGKISDYFDIEGWYNELQ